jgi:hypothetical protein
MVVGFGGSLVHFYLVLAAQSPEKHIWVDVALWWGDHHSGTLEIPGANTPLWLLDPL